jgi:4-hydroxy-2-oxoheptanedioate aldolase
MMEEKIINCGLYVTMSDCAVIEIAAYAGFDFVRIDLEHALLDHNMLSNMIRTANLLNISVQVRISSIEEITRILDCGASAIVVPDVNTVERAQTAVGMCKYAPLGKRGMYPLCRANRYGTNNFEDYIVASNQNVKLIVQIEDKEAIQNLDAILAVEGIDFFATGKADLSQSLNVPGKIDSELVLDAENTIIRKVISHHKKATIMATTIERISELVKMGVSNIVVTTDSSALYQGLRDRVLSLREQIC